VGRIGVRGSAGERELEEVCFEGVLKYWYGGSLTDVEWGERSRGGGEGRCSC